MTLEPNKIHIGDCIEVMKQIDTGSVDAIVCDPPYFLINEGGSGFMGKDWDSIINTKDVIFLWKSPRFVSNVVSLLLSLKIERNGNQQSFVQDSVSTNTSINQNSTLNAQPAEKLSNEQNHIKKADMFSVAGIVLTKADVLDLLKGQSQNLTTVIASQNEDVLFVIPTLFIQKQARDTVLGDVLNLHIEQICEENEIHLTSMEEARINAVIEEMIGNISESKYMCEMDMSVKSVKNIAEEKKYKHTILTNTNRQEIIRYLTLLRFVSDVTPKSKKELSLTLIQKWNETWATEALRVLKPGGFLFSMGGTRTYHRMTCGLEDAGFEIKDCIMWLYGSGFPKAQDIGMLIEKKLGGKGNVIGEAEGTGYTSMGRNRVEQGYRKHIVYENEQGKIREPTLPEAKLWSGWKTPALKPAYEPIVIAQKPCEGSITENVMKHGLGGFNVDECRIPLQQGEDISTDGDGHKLDTNKQGWGYKSVARGNLGRFPANIILDEEAGLMLDEQSERASRFFYCPKASKSERNEGLEGLFILKQDCPLEVKQEIERCLYEKSGI